MAALKTMHPVLYFKGLVVEDMENNRKFGSVAFICLNTKNEVVFEESKPLLLREDEMSDEVAQLKAFIFALRFALTFKITRVCYYSEDFSLHRFMKHQRRKQILRFFQRLIVGCFKIDASETPEDTKVAALLKTVTRLKSRFRICMPSSIVTQDNSQLVSELARSSIAKQAARIQVDHRNLINKESCPICLDDVDSKLMHEVDGCNHRFCRNCLQQYVSLTVRSMMLPRCPEFECEFKMSLDASKNFIPRSLYDTVEKIFKESSVPVSDKVYCPNPRCSKLMSRREELANSLQKERSARTCVKCHKKFCIKCKVLWHSNMSCATYLKKKLYLRSPDGMMMGLAADKKWRQCPVCCHMVELVVGCNRIYCRCGHQFCYLCGSQWKNKKATCPCPLWYNVFR